MMSYEEKIAMYQQKAEFIEKLNTAVAGENNIEKIAYELYERQHPDDAERKLFSELIVVTYKGGAKAIYIATGNSNVANLTIVSNAANRPDYSLVRYYNEMLENPELMRYKFHLS